MIQLEMGRRARCEAFLGQDRLMMTGRWQILGLLFLLFLHQSNNSKLNFISLSDVTILFYDISAQLHQYHVTEVPDY